MLSATRHLILSLSGCGKSLKFFHAGVVCRTSANFDTGIVGFERNKKAYRSQRENSLPSWLESLDYLSRDEIGRFYGAFEGIVSDIVTMKCTQDLSRGKERTREVMEHTLPWAPVCAVEFLMANKFYAEVRKNTGKMLRNEDEHCELSLKLAWILELLAKPSFMTDDIMDGSESRQNLPCWQTVAGVGLHAVNDLILLNNGGFYLLNKYLSGTSYFPLLMSYVSRSLVRTQTGENDLYLLAEEAKSNQNVLSMETALNRAKQSLNGSIFPNMPVIAGMVFNGITDRTLIRKAVEIGMELSTYIIVVDDWVDCYGGQAGNERDASDIQSGSFSWLLYTAHKLGNEEQRRRLMVWLASYCLRTTKMTHIQFKLESK